MHTSRLVRTWRLANNLRCLAASRRLPTAFSPGQSHVTFTTCKIAGCSAAPSAQTDPPPPPTRHEFQAETRKLLDIVARSLYSEKEVFIRELISNASDAIEKIRYLSMSGQLPTDREMKISVDTDKVASTITISDTGIGMTKTEMMDNLGTIARSGSKNFVDEIAKIKDDAKPANPEAIIGQFGVGFYSAFMVAEKIEVQSLSSHPGSVPLRWQSDGLGTYTIEETSDPKIEAGTKVIIHLKPSCAEFADEGKVRDIIKKYSSFVGSNVFLNGSKSNDLRPLWLMDPKEVEESTHQDFYRFIANTYDRPRFTFHFRTDAPMDVRALLYVPESRPGMFEMSREGGSGVALYCRKVLIKSTADEIVPKWMRFVKGVVDSEDIPLNLSRELLQDSAQIRKLRTVITNRFLRFLQDRAKKDLKSFLEFYHDYSAFLKEGIITTSEQYEREEIAKLLRFESSTQPNGETVTIPEYASRMKPGQRDIYYLAAPSRQLAESSPYFEALKTKDVEILFCFESYDELVLMQLQQFDKKKLTSVEKEVRQGGADGDENDNPEGGLKESEALDLTTWFQAQLGTKASKVKTTRKLQSHPCVITVEEMAAARHFIKTQAANFSEEQRYNILQPQLELNTSHPIITKLFELRKSNPKLASLVAEQLFANAMVAAGLVEDPRTILNSINELLVLALEKH